LLDIFTGINFQVTVLTVAILVSGFIFSARLGYEHNSRLYDMNIYSYAQLAKVESPAQQEIYRELARKNLEASEDYRQASIRTTDMFAISLIAIITILIAIVITVFSTKLKRNVKTPLHYLAVCFFILALLSLLVSWVPWFKPEMVAPLRLGDRIPGFVREVPRLPFVEELIQNTDYLEHALHDK
jgi:magnesium-transporting ATPase (P-type)